MSRKEIALFALLIIIFSLVSVAFADPFSDLPPPENQDSTTPGSGSNTPWGNPPVVEKPPTFRDPVCDQGVGCDELQQLRNTTGTGAGAPPDLTVSHSPTSPGEQDEVKITAALVVRGKWTDEEKCTGFLFWRKCAKTGTKVWTGMTVLPTATVQIFVDDVMKKECKPDPAYFVRAPVPAGQALPPADIAYKCEHSSKYPAGSHTYYALLKAFGKTSSVLPFIGGGPIADIKTETKTFVVGGGGGIPPPIGTSISITSPAAGDEWVRNNTYKIRWEFKGTLTGLDAAELYLSKRAQKPGPIKGPDCGGFACLTIVPERPCILVFPAPPGCDEPGSDTFIASVKITDESYDWTVPASTAPDMYQIYIKQVNGSLSDVSDLFSIVSTPGNKTKPSIDMLQPASGTVGTSVTVKGSGFLANNAVRFGNGTIENVSSFNGKTLQFTVPTVSAGNYTVAVLNANGVSNAVVFEVTSAAPPPPPPSGAICGDCDSKTGDGVKFEIKPGDITVLNLFVCAANASEAECRQSPSAGADKPLICEGVLANSCQAKCLNRNGAYYVVVDGFKGLVESVSIKDPLTGSYGYECPSVDIEKIVKIKQSLEDLKARIDVLIVNLEILNATEQDNATKAKWEKYLTGFREISAMIAAHIDYLNTVIVNPTQPGIDEAVKKTEELRQKILDKLKNLTIS